MALIACQALIKLSTGEDNRSLILEAPSLHDIPAGNLFLVIDHLIGMHTFYPNGPRLIQYMALPM